MFYGKADAGQENFFLSFVWVLVCFVFPSLSCSFLAHPQNLHLWLHRHVPFRNTKSAQNESLLVITALGQLSAKHGHQNSLKQGQG